MRQVQCDVPVDVAREQALSWWWAGRTDPNADLGGRFVPQVAIDACYTKTGASTCLANAQELRRRVRRLDGLTVRMLKSTELTSQRLWVVGDD